MSRTRPPAEFSAWFERATGHAPYEYQRALAEASGPPSVIAIPTGAGKTQALIGAWMYQRSAKAAPRRLVYALPMRTLVEQTAEVASEMRESLKLTPDALPIHILMGGQDLPSDDWRLLPERDQILIGTIDMLISRALNRGYAESRFAWPVSFGLLNSDCRWVFDEVQLMGPARATSAQLDGLRAVLGSSLPCETTWVSATVDENALTTVDRPSMGVVMSLPELDRSGLLAKRLNAPKVLERFDLSDTPASDLPKVIAKVVRESHVVGTRTLAVLNTVDLAQKTFLELRRSFEGEDQAPIVLLLHSRFRPRDREAHMRAAVAESDTPGMVVIATQVIEAGVDVSARTLITETAPFSSIVQRLGRCNRAGEHVRSTVVWLDRGPTGNDAAGKKLAAPYDPVDTARSREALIEMEGKSLSPTLLEETAVPESTDDSAVLRRCDLLDLFDTSPDLSGTDIDIAPFIRDDDERSVTVFFRELVDDSPKDEAVPTRAELVQVPRDSLGKRRAWIVDHVDGSWTRAQGRVPPGAIVMLDAGAGGYTGEVGWDPTSKLAVAPLLEATEEVPQGFGDDPGSVAAAPQLLLDHLEQVAREVDGLAKALGLEEHRASLCAAGSLHDVGKAHPVFQETLRKVIDIDTHPERDSVIWAKSGKRGGKHSRPYFRHELASALAISDANGAIDFPARELTRYLVAAHHGKVRLSIRPAPGEAAPAGAPEGALFALGVIHGDELPALETPLGAVPATTLDLGPMELGAEGSFTDAAVRLRDAPDLGPFKLAFLEALLRVADWRASA